MPGNTGECLLLLRRYFHRTPEDLEGLTFKQWRAQKGEFLVVNSSELRAVQGRQVCDFRLIAPKAPKPLKQQLERAKKQKPSAPPPFDPKQRLRLDREIDRDTRADCLSG